MDNINTDKCILVTGGAGFIGANLCRELLKRGESVVCVDCLYESDDHKIRDLIDNVNFDFVNLNINTLKDIKLRNIKQIYHLACPASPPRYQKDPMFTMETNYIGTKNMLELAVLNKCPILFTSTSEIYGDPTINPQVEEYTGNVNTQCIRSCYDEGKRFAETMVFEYMKKYDLDTKIVRIFNTYGPYMDVEDGRVVSNFINQCIDNTNITIYGSGSQTRSLCYVSDMVDGLIKFMNSIEHGPINMGNPNELTIKDLAVKIKNLADSSSEIIHMKIPEGDPLVRCPNINKAITKLKWIPVVDLDSGLLKTIEYYRNIR